jgi:hypothetical protein
LLGCAQGSNAVAAVHVSNRVEEVVRGEVVVVVAVGARAASKRTPTRRRSALRVADSRAEKLHRVSFHSQICVLEKLCLYFLLLI